MGGTSCLKMFIYEKEGVAELLPAELLITVWEWSSLEDCYNAAWGAELQHYGDAVFLHF